MTPLAWCIILLTVGIALIFLEMFLPSAGVLSFLAVVAVVCSIVYAYMSYGPAYGTAFLALAAVVVPGAVAMALRWYPNTPLGRRIFADKPTEEDVLPDDEETQRLKQLKGKMGVAKTALLPGGAVKIDGRTYDAVSDGGAIEPGDTVLVVGLDPGSIVVRKVTGPLPTPATPAVGDDLLSQPLDSLGIDPFDDPLS